MTAQVLPPNGPLLRHHGKTEGVPKHYKDWPNTAGVTGVIPAYAAGTLYRTGPANYTVTTNAGRTWSADHWFDGFTQIHRFQIIPSDGGVRVVYNSRRTADAVAQRIRETGEMKAFTFGQKRDPCQSFFKKLMSTFIPLGHEGSEYRGNIGVALSVNMPGISPTVPADRSSGIRTLTAKTDANLYLSVDPETLEPAGLASQTVLHADLKGQLAATHAKTCPKTGDIYNYNLEIASRHVYRVFCVEAETQKTTILATIEAPGAYLHSLFLTEHHVILCVWSSHFTYRGLSLIYNRNILESIADPLYSAAQPACWYVVSRDPTRAGNGLVATYTTPPFFAFHAINAYEEPSASDPSAVDIVADVPAFSDTSVLTQFYYKNLMSDSATAPDFQGADADRYRSSLTRYRLPALPHEPDGTVRTGTIDFAVPRSRNLELPTLNPAFVTRRHRYVYGVTTRGASTFFDGLTKFDADTRDELFWQVPGHTAGEPIFVRDPEGGAEDDGCLLTVVLDGFEARSYLLCLDARDLTELGRAELRGVVGLGFHGTHVPSDEARRLEGADY